MNDQLCKKIEELLLLLEKDERLLKMKRIAENVKQNEELILEKKNLDKLAGNKYSLEYREARNSYFEHPEIREYIYLESEFEQLIRQVNQKFKSLKSEKSCEHESN